MPTLIFNVHSMISLPSNMNVTIMRLNVFGMLAESYFTINVSVYLLVDKIVPMIFIHKTFQCSLIEF